MSVQINEVENGIVTRQVIIQAVNTVEDLFASAILDEIVERVHKRKEMEMEGFASYTINQVRGMLRVGQKTVERLIDEGKLQQNKDGQITYKSLKAYRDNA